MRKTRQPINLTGVKQAIAELELPHEAYELLANVECSDYLQKQINAWLDKYEMVYSPPSRYATDSPVRNLK